MDASYKNALLTAQLETLAWRIGNEGWVEVTVERDEDVVYVGLPARPATERYLAKIDTAHYPVEPYWVGFVDPALSLSERRRVSDADPRYWPLSGVPGLDGSFHVAFPGAYRAFWCRECTVQYFHYHGAEPGATWDPARWPLDVVVAHLREAVTRAHHPRQWRRLFQTVLRNAAANASLQLPEGAGIDHA